MTAPTSSGTEQAQAANPGKIPTGVPETDTDRHTQRLRNKVSKSTTGAAS